MQDAVPDTPCHLCGATLLPVAGFAELLQVTSDCRPWGAGGRLAVCGACDAVQKAITPAWQAQCAEIYASYAIYRQASGHEQRVFDQAAATAAPRSARLLARLAEAWPLPPRGRLLDIGCGNGAFLAAFGAVRPGWALTGADVSEVNRRAIEALPGVTRFFTGDIRALSGPFDIIVMIHCLEHIPAPAAFLRHVATLLAPDGRLLIEVPDLAANPFDPLVADHATHFLAASLRRTVAQAGLGIVACSDHWVPKELSVLAARAASAQAEPTLPVGQATASGAVRWLHGLLDLAAAQPGPLGIFGTSIAASWLAAQLGTRAAFFIDEDPDRVGSRHLGLPILAPSAAAADAVVMLPFPPAMARAIAARWPAIRGVCP